MKRLTGALVTAAALMMSAGYAQAECDLNACDNACVNDCDFGLTCDSGCDACAADSCDKRLLGLFKQSDHCFDDFISPMINPVFFEDPRTLTEARAIYARHETPNSVGSLGLPGGNVQLFAVQM